MYMMCAQFLPQRWLAARLSCSFLFPDREQCHSGQRSWSCRVKCIIPAWAFNSSFLWYKLQSLSCPQIPSGHHFKGPTVILLGIFPDVYRLWEWQISFILYVYKYINDCKFLVDKFSVIVSMECLWVWARVCVCVWCLSTYGFNIILGCLVFGPKHMTGSGF